MSSMKHTRIFCKLICIVLCLVMVLPLSGCGETKLTQREVYAMDTVMTLSAYGKNAEAGLRDAESIILSMDAQLDPELDTSVVYAINHSQGAGTVVSGQVAEMLSTAHTVYRQSEGALDLTLYPLIKRWGFIDGKYYVPTPEEISEDLSRLCFNQLVLTSFPNSGSYSCTIPSYGELSFAAVAKGCASDNAIEAMRQAGVTSGIISLGGNVQTLGLKPDGSEWNVAIQDPNNTSSYLGVINVGETAVVTSGTYQRFFEDDRGTVYHHLINPASGYPVSNSLESVTIICPDGTLADCLSTAMIISGMTKAINYWREYGGFEMVLVTKENQIVCTKGLIEKFTLANSNYSLKFVE
ncbi:MAG: FAD:protein FMN transferase [Candidatus Limivicinus sp.]|jgi:thiamine biosynthesis lipoprotein